MPKKVDANQPEIVEKLREWRFSVTSLHSVGRNVPDLLIGDVLNFLIEIKSEKGKLSEGQKDWHLEWAGHSGVARNFEEVIEEMVKAVKIVKRDIDKLERKLERIMNDE